MDAKQLGQRFGKSAVRVAIGVVVAIALGLGLLLLVVNQPASDGRQGNEPAAGPGRHWVTQRDFMGQPVRTTVADELGQVPTGNRTALNVAAFGVGAAIGFFVLPYLAVIVQAIVILVALALAFYINHPVGWLIVGVIVGSLLVRQAYRRIRGEAAAAGGSRPKSNTFGSAEWATLDHLQGNGLIGSQGYALGYFVRNGQPHPIHYTGDRHLLTVAPTRAGKGVAAIIPNLLTHRGSAFVIDPKGENAMVTARQRMALGQKVHVLDPWGLTDIESSTFNPLAWLNTDDEDVGENALIMADAMIARTGGGNTFWDEEAVGLLWGLILFVALDRQEGADRTLGGVRDLINLGPDALSGHLEDMQKHDNLIVRSTAERTLAKEPNVRASVFTTLQSHTHFLDSPRMRISLGNSPRTFAFEDLKRTPTTVYLVLPADRLQTFGRWLRLLVQQAITVNARNLRVKPAGGRPILFLLDELAALGKLSKVEEAYGLMAGFGMQLWGIVQDLSQLDRIYDKGWETFIGNSGVLQYFGSRDEKTASYFSKLCGVTTVEKFSVGRSISRSLGISRGTSRNSSSSSGGQGGSFSSSSGSSYSQSDSTTTSASETADTVQRPLAFPDELMVMRKNQGLLLVENFNPVDSRKIEWFTDPAYRELGVNIRQQPARLAAVQSAGTPAASRPPATLPAPASGQ